MTSNSEPEPAQERNVQKTNESLLAEAVLSAKEQRKRASRQLSALGLIVLLLAIFYASNNLRNQIMEQSEQSMRNEFLVKKMANFLASYDIQAKRIQLQTDMIRASTIRNEKLQLRSFGVSAKLAELSDKLQKIEATVSLESRSQANMLKQQQTMLEQQRTLLRPIVKSLLLEPNGVKAIGSTFKDKKHQ